MNFKKAFPLLLALIISFSCYGAPIVTSVAPTNLPTTALAPITLTGTGFTGATAVNFDDLPSLAFVVNSDTSITVTPPDNVPNTVHITVTAPSGTSTPTHADYFTYTGGPWESYISLLNDAAAAHVTLAEPMTANPTIPLIFGPVGVAITPNGRTAYVATAGTNGLSIIDLITNTAAGSINGIGNTPQYIAISPVRPLAYVTTAGSQNLGVINTDTNTIVTMLPIPPSPTGLAITPDGSLLFVANFDNAMIRYFDISADIPVQLGTISAATALQALAITPDGQLLVGAGENGAITVDLTVQPYASSSLLFSLGSNEGVTILPNGTTAYITNRSNSTVTPLTLDTDPPAFLTPINITGSPVGIASAPDSQKIYTANISGQSTTSIDVDTLVTEDLNIGNAPVDIAITPDQAPVARFTATISKAGVASTFDASGSVSPIGTISLYSWDFGDGTTLDTTSPTVEHTFAQGGSFTVTLRVTNSAGTSTTQIFTGRTVSNNGGPSAQFSQVFEVPSGLLPPSAPSGIQIANKFLTQIDYVNILTWQPPLAGTPVAYAIYRDAALTDLVATLPASRLSYEDHNRLKRVVYTYYLVSIDSSGTISAPTVIVVYPKSHSRHHHHHHR